jgi:hypothetical protein
MLPYAVGTPAVFGFASWNGRSLIDNAPDVICSLATNTPLGLGIGKESVSPVSLRPTAATAGMMADQSCAGHGTLAGKLDRLSTFSSRQAITMTLRT